MAKTKAQKKQVVEKGLEALKGAQTLVFTDFTGLPVNDLNVLRKTLKAMGAAFTVVKKRLLKIVFEKEGVAVDPKGFEGQLGVVFSPKDIVGTAAAVRKFSKERKDALKILGGIELKEKKFIEGADVKRIGELPSREALLGQIAAMLTIPVKKFLFVLNERTKMVEKT